MRADLARHRPRLGHDPRRSDGQGTTEPASCASQQPHLGAAEHREQHGEHHSCCFTTGSAPRPAARADGTTTSIVTDRLSSITSIAPAMTGPAGWRRRNISAAASEDGMIQPGRAVSDIMATDATRPEGLDVSTYGNCEFTVDSCELTTELAAEATTRIHIVPIRPSIPMMSAATARPRPAWSWVRVFRIETAAKMTAARLPSPPIHNRLKTNAVIAVPLYGRCVAGLYPYDCDVPTVSCPLDRCGVILLQRTRSRMHYGKRSTEWPMPVLPPSRTWAVSLVARREDGTGIAGSSWPLMATIPFSSGDRRSELRARRAVCPRTLLKTRSGTRKIPATKRDSRLQRSRVQLRS